MMFFSTVPGLNFDMCMISTRIKTIYKSCTSLAKSTSKDQHLAIVVRQIEVPKSKFTYHTEGQFHFGFILFL